MKEKLSIIILSFNTQQILKKCLYSLLNSLSKNRRLLVEIIVVDNGSTDGSVEMLKEFKNNNVKTHISNFCLQLIFNKKNIGYPKGNNQGYKKANGEYILFLNSDAIMKFIDFESLLNYLDKNKDVGVLTVKIKLPNGSTDPASHRGFPTLWNSFCYFLKLEKLFSRFFYLNKLFGGYHLTDKNLKEIHEIDSPTGAFYLTRRKILEKVRGFDEDFFMYGEDLDLSFRIKKLGYKIIYYPLFSVIHYKYSSGIKKNNDKISTSTRIFFYDAMRIFYKKHYVNKYPTIINKLIFLSIDILKKMYV